MFKKNWQFVATLTLLLVSGFLATSLVSYFVARDSISDQIAETTLPLTSDNIYSEIQQDLLRPIFISSLMAQDTFLRDWALSGEHDPKPAIRYLNEIQQRYATVTAFFVSEGTRKYYHSSGVLKTVRENDPQDQWYFRTRQMADKYEINVDADTANATSMVVFINYKVHDFTGRYIGTTGVGLAVDAVKTLVETYQQRFGRRVFFTNRVGAVTLQGSGYTGAANIRDTPGLSKLATNILSSPSGSFTYKHDGKTVYVNSRLVPEFQWYLLVEQEGDAAEAKILNTLFGNLAICLGITVVVVILVHLTIRGYHSRLEEMATTDSLTGAANRHVFDMLFDHALKSARRRDGALSAVILDIDNFKAINDGFGHPGGDVVIRAVARTIQGQIRESDVLCRWGGEEFLVLLPDCAVDEATQLAEKIRVALESRLIEFDGQAIPVTASLGVAQLRGGESQVDLIKRADAALYFAKGSGRNRIALAA